VEVFKEFTFDAAHWLPNVPAGHKCGKLHGHTYRVVIAVTGPVDEHTGFVMDFGDLKRIVQPYIDDLDHSCLNDHIINPTAENLVKWLWEILSEYVDVPVTSIEVWETPTSGARKRAVFG
jgi:6-pyruvoyltetrahydropterin/6-carboxytetrahydropterin synthase